HGLVVLGVHTPEFGFEHDFDNVRRASATLGITYPVALDNNYAVWHAFDNQYWPAIYILDGQGQIRYRHFGEGNYAETEVVLQKLLAEQGRADVPRGVSRVNVSGAEAPADESTLRSAETYVGYEQAAGFSSPGGAAADSV